MFEVSKRSVQRARKHISDLEQEVDDFNCLGGSYKIIEEAYGDRQRFVVKAKLNRDVPDVLESIVTDTIYNLRASLDQVVYSAAVLSKNNSTEGGIDLTKRLWQYPVKSNLSNVEKKLDQVCSPSGIPDKLRELILSQEPYLSDQKESLLWSLNNLANINKHKYLTLSNIRAGHFKLEHVSGPKTVGNFDHFELGGGGFTVNTVPHEAPVGKNEIGLYVSSYNPKTTYKIAVKLDIMFVDSKGMENRTCTFQLKKMAERCSIVIEEFEKMFTDLGYV